MEFYINASNERRIRCVYDEKKIGDRNVVIICHGLLNNLDSNVVKGISDRLTQFNTIRFDFRGNGGSSGVTSYGNYIEEVEDLRDVVQHLTEKEDKDVVCIIGHSKAASVVVIYASICVGFRGRVICLSGRFNMKNTPLLRFSSDQLGRLEETGWFVWRRYKRLGGESGEEEEEVDYIITKESLALRDNLDMKSYAEGVSCQTLVVHGDRDQVVPVEDAYSYHETIRNSRLVVLSGVSHFYEKEGDLDKVVEEINKFIKQ